MAQGPIELGALQRWTEAEKRQHSEIRIEGVVTFLDLEIGTAYLQDATGGIYYYPADNPQGLRVGDQVEMTGAINRGNVAWDFAPDSIRILSSDTPLPNAVALPEDFSVRARDLESQRVRLQVFPYALYPWPNQAPLRMVLYCLWNSQIIEIHVADYSPELERVALGSRLDIAGVAAVRDRSVHGHDLMVFVADLGDLVVLESIEAIQSDLEPVGVAGFLGERRFHEAPIRVRGVVGRVAPEFVTVFDGDGSFRARTPEPPEGSLVGTTVEFTGMWNPGAGSPAELFSIGPPVLASEGFDLDDLTVEVSGDREFSRLDAGGRRIRVRARLHPQSRSRENSLLFSVGDTLLTFEPLNALPEGLPFASHGIYELSGFLTADKQTLLGMRDGEVRLVRKALMPWARSAWFLGSAVTFLAGALLTAFSRSLRSRVFFNARGVQSLSSAGAPVEGLPDDPSSKGGSFEGTGDGVLVCDRDGNITDFNPGFRRIWGVEGDRRGSEFVTWAAGLVADPLLFVEQFNRMRVQPEAECSDVLVLSDGRVIRRSSHPQRVNGRIEGRVWWFRDVTAQEEERAQLDAVLESVNEAIVCSDDAGRIRVANPAAARLLGVDQAELLGAPLHHFLKPEDRSAGTKLEAFSTVSEGEVTSISGERIPVEVSRAAAKLRRTSLYIYVMRDLRERKAREAKDREIERRQKQSEKLNAIGLLAGGVSHDFNNSVGSMLLNAKFLRKRLADFPDLLEAVQDIIDSGEHAKETVEQVLLFSRKEEVELVPVSLVDVLGAVAHELRNRFPDRIAILTDFPAEASGVLGSEVQLRRLFTNLGQNACQAIGEGPGALTFRIHAGEPEREARNQPLVVDVVDTGPGMDEETKKHVFEPFFSTKPVGKGVGLGLAVVYGIVESHGASIEIESASGEGTTFRIRFPKRVG